MKFKTPRIQEVAVLLVTACFCLSDADAADLYRQDKRKPVVHKSYVNHERISRVYECRSGWWQTLSWGKSRPRFGKWCRYIVAQR